MASICTRCALRIQRAASSPQTLPFSRSISTTTARRKAVPTFSETSNPELDDVLAAFRNKHFIPRMVSNQERKLIFSMKNKQYLEENPQVATLGDEEIDLKWIDQRTEIPNRVKLLYRALSLMSEGDKSDWNNLPALLSGLHKVKKTPMDRQLAKMVRLASNAGRFGVVLRCLHQAEKTGMTMKKEEVLNAVVWALRELGRGPEGGWGKEDLEKAIKDANEVGRQLEDIAHGTGKLVHSKDPRTRPEIIAVFLELNAVYVYKFQDGKDEDGKVRAFAERLLANIKGVEAPRTSEPASRGPQAEMLRGVSIWHGLQLAQKILGDQLPGPELARSVVNNWEEVLESLASQLEARQVKEGSYDKKALGVWRDCIRQ